MHKLFVREKSELLRPLYNGDRMKQPEFHRRYQAYPQDVKIELVGGTVFMASPARWDHGLYVAELIGLFILYRAATPGVECGSDATNILGEESEPRPDLGLRIRDEYSGQSKVNDENYVVGAPELLGEIAYSSRAIDMNQKRVDYERAGVAEYIVLCVEELELHWFDFRADGEIRPTREGVSRSRIFPGLWIDEAAMLARDSNKLAATLRQGLATPAHAAFVRKLERARRKKTSD